MNKIYKVIWSRAKHCYIVASEIAKSSGKSSSSNKAKKTAMIAAAVLSLGMTYSAFAADPVTYDDSSKDTITLNQNQSDGVTLANVKGGNVFAGSHYAVNGDDLQNVKNLVKDYDETIANLNTSIATNNTTVSDIQTTLGKTTTTANTALNKVNRGYHLMLNGIRAASYDPTNNDIAVRDGTNSTVVYDSTTSALKVNVEGKGKVASGDTGLVSGDTAYKAIKAETDARTAADKALTDKIGTIAKDGSYIKAAAPISTNLSTLDTQVKANADAVAKEAQNRAAADTEIKNSISSLSDNAVQYTDSTKAKVELGGGATGTTISNVKAGALATNSTEAVNGAQLFKTNTDLANEVTARTKAVSDEETARKTADKALTDKIGTIAKDGSYIKAAAPISTNLSTLDTQVKANADAVAKETTDRKAAVTAEQTARENADKAINNKIGTIAKDGSYIKAAAPISTNLSTLDTQVKANADAVAKETTDRKAAVTAEQTARENADKAINDKIGTIAKDGSYIKAAAPISTNLSTLDTQVKANADAVAKEAQNRAAADTEIKNSISSLSDNAVQYTDSTKAKVELGGGATGTTISNVKAGALATNSTEAVNGAQLFKTNTDLANEVTARTKAVSDEETARKTADQALTDKIGSINANGNYITKDGTVFSNLSTLDTQVKANADAVVKETTDRKAAVTAEQTARENADKAINDKIGTIAKDGSYIKAAAPISTNLSTLDTHVKANEDAIAKEAQNRAAADTEIKNSISSLSDNAVQYTDSTKAKVELGGGATGTTISNVKAGALATNSTEAVNGAQLFKTNTDLANEVTARTKAVSDEETARKTADKALTDKIGTIAKDGSYIKAAAPISTNLSTLDTQVKANADAVAKEAQNRAAADTEIKNSISSLSDNAVQYSDSTKALVNLGGSSGTAIKNLMDGTISETSMDAVNGRQLYATNKNVKKNANNITTLTGKFSTMQSDIDKVKSSIRSVNSTVTSVNSSVSTALSNMRNAQASLADNALSNLSEDGKVVINDIAKDAVDSYLKANGFIKVENNSTNSGSTTSSDSSATTNTVSVASLKASAVRMPAKFAAVSLLADNADTNTGDPTVKGGDPVKYDAADTDSVTLAGTSGTVIRNVKEGALTPSSTEAVNGAQLYAVKEAVSDQDITIANLNTAIATNNETVSGIQTTLGKTTTTANTALNKVNRGYHLMLNGVRIASYDPTNNDIAVRDGTNTTMVFDTKTNAVKLNVEGNGTIADGDTGLVSGGTAYTALEGKANTDLDNLSDAGKKVIKDTMASDLSGKASTDASNIDAGKYSEKLGTGKVTKDDKNLVSGDTVYNAIQELTNVSGDNLLKKANIDLDNLSNTGKAEIKNLSKEAVKLSSGTNAKITPNTDSNGNTTYTIDVEANGKIEDGNTGLISGDTAKKALDQKADVDLSNLSENGKKAIQDAMAVDLVGKANADGSNVAAHAEEWGKALGVGKAEKGNNGLVTGNTLYEAVSTKADKSYVDEGLAKKADIDSVYTKDVMDQKLADKVDKSEFNKVSDQVNTNTSAINDLKNTKADKSYVDEGLAKKADADSVYTKQETDSKLSGIKNSLSGDLANKADKNASNLSEADVSAWQKALSNGAVEKGNTGLISGGAVYDAVQEIKDSGIGLIKVEGDAVKVAGDSSASTVDISGKGSDGNTIGRTLTGVITDSNDPYSAANVGYVSDVADGIYKDMNDMNHRLSDDIKEAGAVASALAGLHHIDYDPDNKLDFAVATAGYRGKSAAALGAFYQPNENIMFSLGGTIGSKHNGWNMGVSFKVGKGGEGVLSRRVLGNQVKALAAQNQALADQNVKMAEAMQDMQEKIQLLLANAKLSDTVQKTVVEK